MKVCQLISTGVYLVMVVFLFKCGPVIANPVTTSSAESVSAVTNKYELMDISVSSCRKVWSVFEPKNLTDQLLEYPEDGTGLSVCRSRTSCCTHQMEERLKTHVQRDFKALLHHSSQTIQGLLISTANDLQDHVTRLARDSENRTQSLFADVYRGMAARAREPIARLFRGLTDFARAGSAAGDQLTAIPPDDGDRLVDVVERFFGELFPLVYHQAVHSHSTAFTRDYARCVGDAASSVQPYGAAPRRLGETLAASLQRTRTFAQALLMAGQVMNTTDRLMDETTSKGLDNCFGALLRLTYCPRCQGLDTAIKPCNGYCLNVVRGCLTQQRAQELDLPWNNFLVETERLAKHILADNLQSLQMLASSISDAVMYAVMDGLQIDAKVKKLCGPARLEPETEETKKLTPKTDDRNVLNGISVSSLAAGHHNKPLEHESPLLTSFLHSLDSIQAKGFFANLPEALCSDESFAEIHDTAECWNGQRVGEYTKTLVRPGVDAQKYNPELAWTESEPDPIIHQLSDKLRHIRQVVMGQLNQAQNLVSESYLRDEEGGSGSGQKPDDDDDDDTEWAQGSGSGNIPGEEQSTKKKTYATDGIDLNTNITPGQGNNSNGQLTPTGKGRGSSPLHTSNLQLFTLIATALLTTYATNTLTSMLYTRTRH